MSDKQVFLSAVYNDMAHPMVAEVGSVVGRSAKALLAPIRGLLWGWEHIEAYVEDQVTKRLENVQEEKRKVPEPEIAVPLLQNLSYTAHNETLRELYMALLANSMNIDKEKVVHPSYVDIIKRMSTLDALLFERLCLDKGYIRVINPHISICNTSKFYFDALPDWYLGWTIEGFDEFDISASLVRLSKFGLIELMYDRTISNADYNDLNRTPFLQSVLEDYQKSNVGQELEISATNSALHVNEYGRLFMNACH